jgi:aryl carrier-like protein
MLASADIATMDRATVSLGPCRALVLPAMKDGVRRMDSLPIPEVVSALAAFPGVADVTVVEYGTVAGDQCLVAYIEPSGPGLKMAALHAHARTMLPGSSQPAAIIVVGRTPRTTDGRVDLDMLPAPELDHLMPYRPPLTARQDALCGLFAEMLRVPRCGLDDDFFQLGGRSVQATLLAARIRSDLGIKVTMADLFRTGTVAALDQQLQEAVVVAG